MRVRLLKALCIVALLGISSVHAAGLNRACTREGGIGGTGHRIDKPQGGIGGTGHQGIGGTGRQDSMPEGGIGGTGRDGIGGTGKPLAAGQQAESVATIQDPNTVAQGGIGGTGHETTPPSSLAKAVRIGVIATLNGIVAARDSAGNNILIARGDEVCDGDVIATGQSGNLKVELASGALVQLRANASMQLQSAFPVDTTANTSSVREVLTLAYGSINVVSHNDKGRQQRDPVLVKSGNVVIRPIGTDFDVAHIVEPVASYASGTYAAVRDGKVEVENGKGRIEISAGEAAYAGASDEQAPILLPRLFEELCR